MIRSSIVAFVVFALLIPTIVKPQIGMLIFAWLSYMNPHRLTFGFAFDFPFALIVGVLTAVGWAVGAGLRGFWSAATGNSTPSGSSILPPLNAATVFLVLFLLWVTITTRFALVPDAAFPAFVVAIKILLFNGLLTLLLMQNRERLHALVWIIVISIGFFSVKGGIFTVVSGGEFLVFGPPASFIEDNNDLALATLMIIPYIRYLQLTVTGFFAQKLLLAAFVLSAISVLGSQSRGAFLGLIVTLGAIFLRDGRGRAMALIGIPMCLVAVFFMPESWSDRMLSIFDYEQDASAQGRLEAWAFAIQLANERLIGGGFEAFLAGGLRNFHSIYFEVLGEQGYFGLFLFLGILVTSFLAAGRASRLASACGDVDWLRHLANMTQVSLLAYASAGAFLNRAFFDLYYHTVAIAILSHVIAVREWRRTSAVIPDDDMSSKTRRWKGAVAS